MTNPLLDDIADSNALPSIEIALPTRGAFYPKGEVLDGSINPDAVTVKALSVLDETSFRDPMMLLSGSAIAKMVKRVVPGVIDPARMCEVDVQAILLACRIASHGPTLKLDHTCRELLENGKECGYENSIDINLNDHIQRFSPYTEEELEGFKLVLPKVGQTVHLRPIPYESTVDLMVATIRSNASIDSFREMGEASDEVLTEEFIDVYRDNFEKTVDTNIDMISASIYYVETKSGKKIFDQDFIREWVVSIHVDDVAAIRKAIRKINDEIQERSRVEYECLGCGSTNSIFVELDPQKLFIIAEDHETETTSSAKPKSTKKPTKKPSKVSQR